MDTQDILAHFNLIASMKNDVPEANLDMLAQVGELQGNREYVRGQKASAVHME